MLLLLIVRSLKSVEHQTAPRNLVVPISVVMPQLPPVDLDQNKKPDPADKIKYGEYITNAAACFDCHTQMTLKDLILQKHLAEASLSQ